MKIVVFHLDLGIGGAEKLIVNLSTAALKLNHEITVVTTHHDPNRCFEETKPDGELGKQIHVYGNFLPRHILGKGTVLCASLRMMYGALMILLKHAQEADVVLTDGVSLPIPLLKAAGLPVLFYCHFPDKLLVKQRDAMSMSKSLYRALFDWVEEATTGCADVIVVNSEFTGGQFKQAFSSLGSRCSPEVLYPTVKDEPPNVSALPASLVDYTTGYDRVFVSLNRFERKKNIMLAVQALELLLQRDACTPTSTSTSTSVLLVIAGGYDLRVEENTSYHKEIENYVIEKGLSKNVVFRLSIPGDEVTRLLHTATAVLYTPENEHFGIVPVEAMQLGTPVIAVSSGGPLESIVDQETGFLCLSTPAAFADAMELFVIDGNLSSDLGKKAVKHVSLKFTDRVMRTRLNGYLETTRQQSSASSRERVNHFMLQVCLAVCILWTLLIGGLAVCSVFLFDFQLLV